MVFDLLHRCKTLHEVIRWHNSQAMLFFSSILPRYELFDDFFPYIYGINFAVEKWYAKSNGACVYIDSNAWFRAKGKPRQELYGKNDGLHPNGSGMTGSSSV